MDEITPFDLERMLIGSQSPLFLVEIIFRIAIIWPWTMLLLRWIGGRSIAQLSLVEFLLVIALGSAVGDSLFYPEVPLIHAMLVIFAIIGIDKLVDWLIRQMRGAKAIFDGQPIEVLRDGVIQCQNNGAQVIGSLELMEMLRLRGAQNLGALRLAYMEPSGQISVFPATPPRRGLPIVPPVECLDQSIVPEGADCCTTCGMISDEIEQPCSNCGGTHWTAAEQAEAFEAK